MIENKVCNLKLLLVYILVKLIRGNLRLKEDRNSSLRGTPN